MVGMNLAVYEPPKQMRAVLLYWRLPEEWAEVLHEWVRAKPPSNPNSVFHTLNPSPVGLRGFYVRSFSRWLFCCLCRRRKQDS